MNVPGPLVLIAVAATLAVGVTILTRIRNNVDEVKPPKSLTDNTM